MSEGPYKLELPQSLNLQGHKVALIDDGVSSGGSMLACAKLLCVKLPPAETQWIASFNTQHSMYKGTGSATFLLLKRDLCVHVHLTVSVILANCPRNSELT